MKPVVALVAVVASATGLAADQSWELRADFESLLPGDPEVAVLRLPDGRSVEVPLPALSQASQTAARRAAGASTPEESFPAGPDGGSAVTVRGPFGRAVRVSVPEAIKDVECDAIHCRSAAEAADVYHLALIGDRLAGESRKAAEKRLLEWTALADTGAVRLGDRWVPPDEARAATEEATRIFNNALELMMLGNGELAEKKLREVVRSDPEQGRASLVMGLFFALVAKNAAKAADQFADAARRDPEDPVALNNLAIVELLAQRYGQVEEHFRQALESSAKPQAIAQNVAWAMNPAMVGKAMLVPPGKRPPKIPERTISALNQLYTLLNQNVHFKPPENAGGPHYLRPDGSVCAVATIPDLAKQVKEAGATIPASQHALGFVVAPGHVVCPRRLLVAADGQQAAEVFLEIPSDRGRRLVATVVAVPRGGDVALLKCEGLQIDPLPLANSMLTAAAITAVERDRDSWLDGRLVGVSGRLLKPETVAEKCSRVRHTAVVPRGLGGGPIVNESGHVVGMIAHTPRTEASGNAGGFGIPIDAMWPIIKDYLPDVEAVDEAGSTQDVVATTAAAVVIVSIASGPVARAP